MKGGQAACLTLGSMKGGPCRLTFLPCKSSFGAASDAGLTLLQPPLARTTPLGLVEETVLLLLLHVVLVVCIIEFEI